MSSNTLTSEVLVPLCNLPKSLVDALLQTPKYRQKDEGGVVDALLELSEALAPLDRSVISAIAGDGFADGALAEEMLRTLAVESRQSHEREKLMAASRRQQGLVENQPPSLAQQAQVPQRIPLGGATRRAVDGNVAREDSWNQFHQHQPNVQNTVTGDGYSTYTAATAATPPTARVGHPVGEGARFVQPQHQPAPTHASSTPATSRLSPSSNVAEAIPTREHDRRAVASVPDDRRADAKSPTRRDTNVGTSSIPHLESSAQDASKADDVERRRGAGGGGLLGWLFKSWDRREKKGSSEHEPQEHEVSIDRSGNTSTQNLEQKRDDSDAADVADGTNAPHGSVTNASEEASTHPVEVGASDLPLLTAEVRRMFGDAERGQSAPSYGVRPIRPEPSMFGYVDESASDTRQAPPPSNQGGRSDFTSSSSPIYSSGFNSASSTPRPQGTIRGALPRGSTSGNAGSARSPHVSRPTAEERLGESVSSLSRTVPAGAPTVNFGPSTDSLLGRRLSVSGRYRPAVSVSISPFDAPQRYDAVVEVDEEETDGENVPNETVDEYGRPVKVVKIKGGGISLAPSAISSLDATRSHAAPTTVSVVGDHNDVSFDALFSKFVEEGKNK